MNKNIDDTENNDTVSTDKPKQKLEIDINAKSAIRTLDIDTTTHLEMDEGNDITETSLSVNNQTIIGNINNDDKTAQIDKDEEEYEECPDFEAYVQEKIIRASSIFSRPVEYIFTLAIIFSTVLTPCIMLQIMFPVIFISLMTTSIGIVVFVFYVLVMSLVGLKLSSFCGCTSWLRITSAFRD